MMRYINSGKDDGANVHIGGERCGEAGFYIHPTIFTEAKPEMDIRREEIFGPVVTVVKFKDEEEAIALANDSKYGLSSVIFSENVNRVLRVTKRLEAGNVYVSAEFL